MPTYDYRCSACGHEFEEFQSITAPPLRKCPKCGKGKLVRLIGTGAGVIFKGSGFYETDYRSEGYKKAAKEAEGGAKTETKSDEKPDAAAAKSDTKTEAKTDSTPAKSESHPKSKHHSKKPA